MRTEHPFSLPRGYVDAGGTVHRDGVMRLATPRDAAVRENQAYLAVLLLSRVIKRIGTIESVTPEVVEELFAVDFDHLQRLYERLNSNGDVVGSITCPE